MSTYDEWQQGVLTDAQAFIAIAGELDEIEPMLRRAEDAKKERRAQLETIVRHAGGKVQAGGYDAIVTQAAEVVSYDTKILDNIMAECAAAGDMYTANRLALARRVSARAGYLKLARAK